MNIAIVKYNAGNIYSVDYALKRLGVEAIITSDKETLMNTNSDLFKGFDKEEFVYFVHSFYVPLNEFTAATTDYILPYSSALHKDNFYATQFHPEKSGQVGERILRNFIEL